MKPSDTDYEKMPFSKNRSELKNRWEKQLKLSVLSSVTDKLKLEEDKKAKDAGYQMKTMAELEKDSP